jgi:hypothetical protein
MHFSSELGVKLSLLDIFFTCKLIGTEFRSLAENSLQSIGGGQLILAVFRGKDIVERVVCAARTAPVAVMTTPGFVARPVFPMGE